MFEFQLELEHLGALWRNEGCPSCIDKVFEGWMGEPEFFEAKGSFGGVAWTLPLKSNRPVIRT